MVACNSCGKVFNSEDELILIKDGITGFFKACPNCNTDNALMDFHPEVIITVRGGIVQAVHSTIEGLVVHVNDHDNDENIIEIGCNYNAVY